MERAIADGLELVSKDSPLPGEAGRPGAQRRRRDRLPKPAAFLAVGAPLPGLGLPGVIGAFSGHPGPRRILSIARSELDLELR